MKGRTISLIGIILILIFAVMVVPEVTGMLVISDELLVF